MRTYRIGSASGFYLGFKSGVFWIRTPKHIFKVLAPCNEPLFSERYIDKPRSLFGWRFVRRPTPVNEEKRG
jgi:hypothetical protein